MTIWNWLEFLALALLGASLGIALLTAFPGSGVRRMADARRQAEKAAEKAAFPIWRLDSKGRVTWSNAAFRNLLDAEPHGSAPGAPARVQSTRDGKARWFATMMQDGTGLAYPIDDLIEAEANLRDMVQSMARTFAQLPTGLAIFDRSRHLQSFNPALADLTGLPPAFLSRRPSLLAMLDAMRDRSMVPEPKDWKSWRRQIADMERAAASSQFDETWTLPGGQTYRVTGRRHLDGGLALMIDDISTEIIRNRRFRADLDLCQAVIDRMEEGIAVFSITGQLVLSNAAYATLWGHDPAMRLVAVSFANLLSHWRAGSAPTGLWAEVEEYFGTLDSRLPWQSEARLLDGRLISCRFAPLTDGAVLVGFRPVIGASLPRAINAAVDDTDPSACGGVAGR